MRGLGGPESAAGGRRLAALLEDRLGGAGDVDALALDVAAGLVRAAGLQVLDQRPLPDPHQDG